MQIYKYATNITKNNGRKFVIFVNKFVNLYSKS